MQNLVTSWSLYVVYTLPTSSLVLRGDATKRFGNDVKHHTVIGR